MKKAYLPLFGLLFSLFGQVCQPHYYDIVRECNLPTVPSDQQEEVSLKDVEAQLLHAFRAQTKMPSDKKRSTALSILQNLEPSNEPASTILFDSQTARDLNLISGDKPGAPYLAEKLNYTKTELGKVYLYGLIGNPIENISELKRRQQIIQLLIKNPQLLQQLNQIFAELGNLEATILSFFAEDSLLTIADRHYFYLNRFQTLLNGQTKHPGCFKSDLLCIITSEFPI